MITTKILNSRGELTNKEKYMATIGGDTTKMQDVRDIVRFDKWALIGEYDDENNDENDIPQIDKRILIVFADDGEVYGTVSDTFIRQFIDCVGLFGDDFKAFSVETATSKGGRDFIKCVYED